MSFETPPAHSKKKLSLSEVCRQYPGSRGAPQLHPSTLVRWILSGVKTPKGRVKLVAVRMGGRWVVDSEALEEFFGVLTAAVMPIDTTHPPRSPAASRRAAEAAEIELKRQGA